MQLEFFERLLIAVFVVGLLSVLVTSWFEIPNMMGGIPPYGMN